MMEAMTETEASDHALEIERAMAFDNPRRMQEHLYRLHDLSPILERIPNHNRLHHRDRWIEHTIKLHRQLHGIGNGRDA